MPSIDMPLKELKKYKGINPKPADFDAYWERALKELDSLDFQTELIPSEFKTDHSECFDLYFTGAGGSRIHVRYARPAGANGETKNPAVLRFHGYTGESPCWNELMQWTAAGFSVFALDSRGQGGLSEDRGGVAGTTWRGQIIRGLSDSPEKLLFRQIFLDTAALARIAFSRPEVDETRVGALGGSQGGALTIACAALEPRIKRIAPEFPFLCDYKRVWEMDLGGDAYSELQYFFKKFDPLHEREQEIFETLGYIDLQFLAPRIKAEVLLGCGLMDEICPPSSQFAMYNKLKAPREVLIYPDFGHEDIRDFNEKSYLFMMGL
ncbi:MAG: acetylxylan esterase [Spirochaetales bacterium]|nr:acetylxylan esterase [Spirochaetales bacterium]